MIVTIDLNRFNINNIFLLDTKRNIIMNGNFTKFIYSNDWFVMSGLYLLFPIEVSNINKVGNKKQMIFHPYQPSNMSIIQDFAKMEYKVLEYYKQTKQCNKKLSNLLSRQLYSGYMKLYKEYNSASKYLPDSENDTKIKQYVIKVSGIWESNEEIGLTYKLFEVDENYNS